MKRRAADCRGARVARGSTRIRHLPACATGGSVRAVKRPLIALLGLILPALISLPRISAADAAASRWTPERAWEWCHSHPWLVGCNFLPSTAVNDVEMWRKESFDAKTIGQAYTLEKLRAKRGESAIRLAGGKDPRSGIQFSRVIRLFDGSTRVSFEATMKNIDTKPRRWGIWAHTQLDGAKADGSGHNSLMQAWCPLNPQSKFAKGYDVIFGDKNNPSFQPDAARGLMRVQYQYQVGKIGLDSHAGWVATADGASGAVFVQRFVFEPKKEYPDGSSVEFWLNGVGQIHAYNKDMTMPTNATENPYVFESEVLSPFADLKPGRSYTWRYDWYACNLGGDFPVLNCSDTGVVAEPLSATEENGLLQLRGRFGVFAPGQLEAVLEDKSGRVIYRQRLTAPVTPLAAATITAALPAPPSATAAVLSFLDVNGRIIGELARTPLRKP
jgi:hypothetical protein